ncbi:MAG: HD domain-containing protein [Patescibacteria group bacterium]|nr:HD domain-containing protein [Patescibacteria group bacterium]
MGKKEIINKTKKYVRRKLGKEATGHDWWHALRVWKTVKYIAKKEGGDLFTVELAALLHDIADWKFNKGKIDAGARLISGFLGKLEVDKEIIKSVCEITKDISFKGAKVKLKIKTKEGKIVQDADRLDALGAIGIARAFSYGGYAKREIYNPKIKFRLHKSFKQYQQGGKTSINHFFEKLLFLKNLMNTKTGKKLAGERHEFLEKYLKQFFKEWNLK